MTASDPHLRWWFTEREGKKLAQKGNFHFCEDNSKDCKVVKRGLHMHPEKFREITTKELSSKVPGWTFSRSCVAAVKDFHKRRGERPARPEREGGLPWHESG